MLNSREEAKNDLPVTARHTKITHADIKWLLHFLRLTQKLTKELRRMVIILHGG